MYIRSTMRGYDRHGQQRASGLFLAVFSRGRELRAVVRSVRLTQFGHWMMGDMTIAKCKFTMSGCYGHDGLPGDMPIDRIWNLLLPVPAELTEKFWKGGGHNTCGEEGPEMHQWALDNLKALRKAGR